MSDVLKAKPTSDFIEFKKEEIEQSIPDRFQQQVQRCPDQLAVKTGNYEFTYDELNKTANRMAWAILVQRNDGQEQIALLLENDAPMIAAMLGVLKSGKTYVPLDPSLPRARASYILEDSQASLIVTNDRNLPLAQELIGQNTRPLINIDELDLDLSSENPGLFISPDAFVWILYTSGSTGRPKGVLQTHGNVLHYVRNYTNGLHICVDDRYALLYSCSVIILGKQQVGNKCAVVPFAFPSRIFDIINFCQLSDKIESEMRVKRHIFYYTCYKKIAVFK